MAFLGPAISAGAGIVGDIASLFGGGPTAQEREAQAQSNSMANALQGAYQTEFGQYEDVAKQLQSNLNQELLQGEQGQGLTSAQMSGLQTQALDTTAQNYANAARAAQTRAAGMGGGAGTAQGSGLQSGVESQIEAGIAAQKAGELSNQQLGIQQLNAQEALQKQQEALGGLAGLAGGFQQGALASSGQELGQNKEFYGQSQDIQEQQQQKEAAQGAGIGGLLGSLAGGFGNLDTTGGSTGGEQFKNFLTGLGG